MSWNSDDDELITPKESELVAQCAADISPEAIKWLWPGRVPIGKLTLIAGEAGLGKSQIGYIG